MKNTLVRKLFSPPQTIFGKKSAKFCIISFLLGFPSLIPTPILPVIVRVILGPVFLVCVLASIVLGIIGIVNGIKSLKDKERSLLVLIPLGLGLLIVLFWILFLIGEIVFPH